MANSDTKGCYLTFTEENNGTLSLNWSESKIDGALMFFEPFKAVPAFKFKQNGGKSEIVRDAGGGVKIKNFFTGVVQFVKAAKLFLGKIRIEETGWPNPTAVYVLREDSTIVRVDPHQDVALADVVGVAAVHAENCDLNCERLAKQAFLSAGNAAGAAIAV